MQDSNYLSTLDYMFSKLPMFSRIGSDAYKKDLTNITNLCEKLNHPQDNYPCIHIGGTNGKGSTTNYLASILIASGLKVGIYTSPHLVDFRERIKIGNTYISEKAVVDFIEKMKPYIELLEPSFFEISVAMAFEYFKEEQVDIALIEVGLGGRLDSTNIITPLLSIITNISLDHTNMLGTTISEIAHEKAGIIKHKTPVIIGESNDIYNKIFEEKASNLQSPILLADKVVKIESNKDNIEFLIDDMSIELIEHTLPSYQISNLRTVILAYNEYSKITKKPINPLAIYQGISNIYENTRFLGRWMKLNASKHVILECAHNLAGVLELNKTLQSQEFDKLYIIYGAVKDKDLNDIISAMPQQVEKYILTQADIPRAMPADDLLPLFKKHHSTSIEVNASPIKSLKNIMEIASNNDLIVVTGSIFLVGEVLRDLEEINN